jgi:molybdopterin converting factor subunit 1
MIAVQLFARARDLAGMDRVEVSVQRPATVAAVRSALMIRCPKLAAIGAHLLAAVDSAYADDSDSIPASGEVAFFPPVSGG